MLKIKKEKKIKVRFFYFPSANSNYVKTQRERAEGEELDSDESDWEPEAEVMPVQRETRSGRQRKRPSFFQEFESQENNLDSILAEFEQTQVSTLYNPPKCGHGHPDPRLSRKKKLLTF